MDIRFVKRDVLKEKPDQKHLGFGKYMTDYMFVMDWTKEDGWKDARIVPEGPISLEPACVTLHYAQETFEGMKAYRTAEGKILYQVIQMDLGQRGIQVETLEMFPAYKRQKSYLLAGILIDDISNYALLYNVHAIKKNGELHRGMDGFCQEKNMVQVPLTVLSEWERIECVDHEIFIVENPSVFALICGEKSCMCMNGQPRLAGLLVLELLAKSGTKVYYSGDLDPEGILIAQKLSQYYRGTFCYWHMTPFDYEQCRSKEIISEKRKKMLQKITDERLLPVVDAVTKYGMAGYQESIGLNQISI